MPEEEMMLLNDETIVRVRVDIKGNITLKRMSNLSCNVILIYLIYHARDLFDYIVTHLSVCLSDFRLLSAL